LYGIEVHVIRNAANVAYRQQRQVQREGNRRQKRLARFGELALFGQQVGRAQIEEKSPSHICRMEKPWSAMGLVSLLPTRGCAWPRAAS
jgi:hypothetical protein